MKKYKYLSLILVFVIIAVLTEAQVAKAADKQLAATDTSDSGEERLKLVYFNSSMTSVWIQNIFKALEYLGEQYNFEVVSCDADSNQETQLSQIDTMLMDGIDGAAIMICDEGAASAVAEKFEDAGVPLIAESLTLRDADGKLVVPAVELDARACGQKCGEWIVDNCSEYGFDISDLSKVGILCATETTFVQTTERSNGFIDGVKAKLPAFDEKNIYIADAAAEATTKDQAEAAFKQTSAILAAHPEIEYWLMFASVDDYGIGALRAVENAGAEEKTIITSVGGERVIDEWAQNPDCCWRATAYFDALDCAKLVVEGLLQNIREDVPIEEIFADTKEDGEKYGCAKFSGEMCTADNYKDFIVEY